MIKKNNQGGIILKIIFFILILVLILNYFKIDIKNLKNSTPQYNFEKIKGSGQKIYNSYFKNSNIYLWQNFFIEIFWEPFIANVRGIDGNNLNNFQNLAPTFNFGEGSDVEINENK